MSFWRNLIGPKTERSDGYDYRSSEREPAPGPILAPPPPPVDTPVPSAPADNPVPIPTPVPDPPPESILPGMPQPAAESEPSDAEIDAALRTIHKGGEKKVQEIREKDPVLDSGAPKKDAPKHAPSPASAQLHTPAGFSVLVLYTVDGKNLMRAAELNEALMGEVAEREQMAKTLRAMYGEQKAKAALAALSDDDAGLASQVARAVMLAPAGSDAYARAPEKLEKFVLTYFDALCKEKQVAILPCGLNLTKIPAAPQKEPPAPAASKKAAPKPEAKPTSFTSPFASLPAVMIPLLDPDALEETIGKVPRSGRTVKKLFTDEQIAQFSPKQWEAVKSATSHRKGKTGGSKPSDPSDPKAE